MEQKPEQKLVVSVSPHIREDVSVPKIMYSVVFALLPALIGSVYFFGSRALLVTIVAVASALGTEALYQRVARRPLAVKDGSALITGILLAFNLPASSPLWLPLVGSFFAIFVAKQLFGGLGYNFINPALAGRAFLTASWPSIMTGGWTSPIRGTISGMKSATITKLGLDTVTQATPLNLAKEAMRILNDPSSAQAQLDVANRALHQLNQGETLRSLFFGNVGGCLGETSTLLLLLGAIFLLIRRYIDWRIPLGYLLSVALLTGVLHTLGVSKLTPLFHILSGGIILGAFFMATDMVTTPVTQRGRWLFGTGCGIITVLIRVWGGYPEGCSYSILLMNVFTPLIDRATRPKKFGQ